MTWATTKTDIQTALTGLGDGPQKQMGQALLVSFNKALEEYKKINGNNETQVTESAAYVTWSTVTMPAFLVYLRAFADSYDGQGTSPTGGSPHAEFNKLKNRLKEAAKAQSNTATANLIYRAVNLTLPAQPPRYGSYKLSARDNAARTLDELENEAELWLAL